MTGQKEVLPQKLAGNWPYKVLNFLPYTAQLKFISWRSGKPDLDYRFKLGDPLSRAASIIIFLDIDPKRFFLSLPLVEFI